MAFGAGFPGAGLFLVEQRLSPLDSKHTGVFEFIILHRTRVGFDVFITGFDFFGVHDAAGEQDRSSEQ